MSPSWECKWALHGSVNEAFGVADNHLEQKREKWHMTKFTHEKTSLVRTQLKLTKRPIYNHSKNIVKELHLFG